MKKRAIERYQIGQLARSLQGRDKDRVYVITRIENGNIFVSDGEHFPVQAPKGKNPFHLQVIGTSVISKEYLLYIEDTGLCNEHIKQAIHAFENRSQI